MHGHSVTRPGYMDILLQGPDKWTFCYKGQDAWTFYYKAWIHGNSVTRPGYMVTEFHCTPCNVTTILLDDA